MPGEAGKATIFAFENGVFSLAFFACFGPLPSRFSVLGSLSCFPARVVQVHNAKGAQRTRAEVADQENFVSRRGRLPSFFPAVASRRRVPDSIVEVSSLGSYGLWVEDSFPLLPFLKFFPLCFADALADVIFAGFVFNVS